MNGISQYEKIDAWVRSRREDIIADLRDLVNIPSIACRDEENPPFGQACREALGCILEKGRQRGFHCLNYEYYGCSVACRKPDKSRKQTGLWAHLDVVPPGEGWEFPPFSMTEKEGYLIGRGVQDNKSAAVALLYVLEAMEKFELSQRNHFTAYFGCAEEIGMYDARYLKEHVPLPELSIVVDCGFPVCYGESGILNLSFTAKEPVPKWLVSLQAGSASNTVPEYACLCIKKKTGDIRRLEAVGKAVHTGVAETGENALCLVLEQAMHEEEARDFLPFRFPALVQDWIFEDCAGEGHKVHGAVTIGKMEGSRLVYQLDIRYPILGEDGTIADGERVCACLKELGEQSGLVLTKCKNQKPSYYPPDKKEVQVLEQAFCRYGGYENRNFCMSGGTYARELSNAFAFGMALPEKSLCPGLLRGGDYHQPNESLNIQEYLKAITLLIVCLAELDKNG